jgi:hypothetical protein
MGYKIVNYKCSEKEKRLRCIEMGVFKKEKEYSKSVDLDKLTGMMENYLKEDKWKVQVGNAENGKLIQAKKGGIVRDIFAADRALNILFTRTPNGFKVTMGVGKWLQNIGVTLIESVLLTGLFLVIDVPEMLWNAEIENKIMKKIDEFVAQM